MKIKIECKSRFGGFIEHEEVSNQKELETLEKKWGEYPQDRNFSTTLVLSGIDVDGNCYCNQIL